MAKKKKQPTAQQTRFEIEKGKIELKRDKILIPASKKFTRKSHTRKTHNVKKSRQFGIKSYWRKKAKLKKRKKFKGTLFTFNTTVKTKKEANDLKKKLRSEGYHVRTSKAPKQRAHRGTIDIFTRKE